MTRTPGVMLGLAFALVFVSCSSGSMEDLTGIVRTPLPDVSDVSLPDAGNGGEEFPFVAEQDHILLLYFGYTLCPDVCPTTLADLKVALGDLGGDAENVDMAMITVDPNRDTAEVLTGYVQSFIPGAHALRTDDPDRLAAAADAFGAVYGVETDDEGTIEVTHSAWTYAVGDDGKLLVTWAFGTPAADIEHDLRILLDNT